jgi:hypothetical protein
MPVSLREAIARSCPLEISDELVAGRAALLAKEDRALLEAVWLNDQTCTQVARLARRKRWAVWRKVRKLLERLNSPQFLAAARLLPYLQEPHRSVVQRYFCQGQSLSAVGAATGVGYHETRRILDEVRGVVSAMARAKEEDGAVILRRARLVRSRLINKQPQRRPVGPAEAEPHRSAESPRSVK